MKQNLKSYHQLITDLEDRFNDVNHLHGQRDSMASEAEEHRTRREKVLADAVTDTSEAAIDQLAKHNARQEVFGAKLQRLTAEIEKAEENLQLQFTGNLVPPFMGLYRALHGHRFERAKAQIAALLIPERVLPLTVEIERLVLSSRQYVLDQQLEVIVPEGAASPLHETFPGSPWLQYRDDTIRILLQAVESGIEKGKRLLAAIESEEDFAPPEIATTVTEVKELELAEA